MVPQQFLLHKLVQPGASDRGLVALPSDDGGHRLDDSRVNSVQRADLANLAPVHQCGGPACLEELLLAEEGCPGGWEAERG